MTEPKEITGINETFLSDIAPPPSQQADPLLYRWIVGGLIALAVLAVVGIILLSFFDKPIDAGLIAIGAAAGGALGGTLIPTGSK